jgi:isopentenyldiphosphate isomerase
MASTELVDIVNESNEVIGSIDVESAHNQKLMHRVAGVFVFDVDGNLYLQKGNKYGKLDLSVGGHVHQGESYEIAAQREMREELGLEVPIKHISTFLPSNARLNHFWAIYTAIAPTGWVFKETEEVASLQKMDLKEIVSMVKFDPDMFTHGFINTLKEFVRVKNL